MKKTLLNELNIIKSKGLSRGLKVITSSPDREIIIKGKKYLNFSSNNYLGLANHPEVKKAGAAALKKYGCGGTSSRLVAGTLDLHAELEEKLAELKQTESALVFPSGFQANTGIISTLLGNGDAIIMDKLNHASLWDAAKLSKARVFVYQHRDLNSLEKVLKRSKNYNRRLVVTDSIFSMDGDLAPLNGIAGLAKKYGAWSMIDDAHATGIFGKTASGLAEHFKVQSEIDIIMGTLSKALGSQGGFVCGPKELIDYVISKSRSFIYTTALAPSCAGSALKALDIIKKQPDAGGILLKKANEFRLKLRSKEYDTLDSESQIVPLLTGEIDDTVKFSSKLLDKGIFAPAIRPPTVPVEKCRLRFSLMSGHSDKDIDRLVEAISNTN